MIGFGPAVCTGLASAERREWLVTNGLGGFASGTIAGTLTRRYHGLLIAAARPPVGRRLMVAKIEETAGYLGGAYDLAANRWNDDYLSPLGFTLIERFDLEGTMPVWQFAFADALVEKRVWMEHGENAVFVEYRIVRAAAPVDLTLRALVNDRDFHANTHAGERIVEVEAVEGGLHVAAQVEGGLPLTVRAPGAECTIESVWYRDFVLAEETRRGLDDRDDHLCAGRFRISLQAGESVTVVARTGLPVPAEDAGASLERFRGRAKTLLDAWHGTQNAAGAPPWMAQCVLAADQFVVARAVEDDPEARSIVAGYHWFGDWGRDTAIALPGLTLTTGRPDVAKNILLAFARYMDGGMLPNFFPDSGSAPEYNAADAAIWYVEAVARYVDATGDREILERLMPALRQIADAYRKGTRYGIHVDPDDGLVVAAAPGVQLTWMDAKVGDWVVTPRMGKPVEISALWYNALRRLARLAELAGTDPKEFERPADAVRFDRFWNAPAGYCFDVLDTPSGNDATLRPNQLFAASLRHSALDPQRRRAIVDACAARLVTPAGIRTLPPDDPRFAPRYEGTPRQRDAAYHQGTAWAWLLGAFAVAHARAYGDLAIARSFLQPLADRLGDYGIGSVAEIADATAPFTPRGAIAQAWSVAELLRGWNDVAIVVQRGSASPSRQ